MVARNKFFLDDGREFASKHVIDLCENFNIKILATPAESPWLNGLCEQHSKLLTDMLLKIKEDTPCSWEILKPYPGL